MELQFEFEFELWFELRLWLVGLHGDVEGRAEFRGLCPSARHAGMWRP